MKKFLSELDKWAAKAIKFVRPGKHKTPNALTDDVHLKERSIPPRKDRLQNQEEKMEEQTFEKEKRPLIMPDEYYLTRTGQMIRKPRKGKRTYPRYKFLKRTK